MKRHWICLQLRFEASQGVELQLLSRRAALSGSTSLQLLTSLVLDYTSQELPELGKGEWSKPT